MGEDDTPANNRGGWSEYKRLVMRLIDDLSAEVKRLNDTCTKLTGNVEALSNWVKDIDTAHEKQRERMINVEKTLVDLKDLVQRSNTSRYSKQPGVGSFLVEVWRSPLGKVIFFLLSLALVVGAGAVYNIVSDTQIDIGRAIDHGNEAEGSGSP